MFINFFKTAIIMKQLMVIAALAAASMSVNGANFITMGGDSIRINPNKLDGYTKQTVTMVTDGYCDTWNVVFGYPDGMSVKLVAGITALEGMTVGYTDHSGMYDTYEATLNVSAAYGSVGSTTASVYGFWDYNEDGAYEPYGTIKWAPGTHEMFALNFFISPSFRRGYITMDATFNSSPDSRGAILSNVRSFKKCFMWVGHMRGDVTGDERINIADVVMLVDYILEREELDEFQSAAADANCDGMAGIADVTTIIDMILNP
jgi:hypothetical protein